uniref:Galp galanin-like peptide n=1 Tax=Phallusia mammillata TaxID=59560 RepID=A0A6F9DE80_9ASCI|nr:galp galanin-like peptide precursor [Phallusia mammillata]
MASCTSLSTATVCFVILMTLMLSSKSEAVERMNAKRFRGQGGWTLNSVGYNGGLGALQKLFNKRGDDDMGVKVGEGWSGVIKTDDLVSDFVQFLKLRESGLLGPEMLRCVLERLDQEPRDM